MAGAPRGAEGWTGGADLQGNPAPAGRLRCGPAGGCAVKAVLFDVDGTLVDTVDLHAESWVRTFRHIGHEVPFEAVRAQIGKGGDQLMPVFLPEDVVDRRGKEMEAFRKGLYMGELIHRARPFPGVAALFRRLRADGRRIILASSGKPEELDHYKTLLGIEGLVDAATTSEDAERSKPFPDIFLAALDGLPADQAIVVGDSPYDAEAAGKAGLRTIGLLCGGFPEQDLRAAGCVALYRDPAELLERYGDSPLARG